MSIEVTKHEADIIRKSLYREILNDLKCIGLDLGSGRNPDYSLLQGTEARLASLLAKVERCKQYNDLAYRVRESKREKAQMGWERSYVVP